MLYNEIFLWVACLDAKLKNVESSSKCFYDFSKYSEMSGLGV